MEIVYFCASNPGSELKKQMQAKEEEMRAGGREAYPIKIIETAGRTLEQTLVKTDPFDGNKCTDEKCEPKKNPKNKINCRRNVFETLGMLVVTRRQEGFVITKQNLRGA